MVEGPAWNRKGREHQTGAGRTEPRRVMRSGNEDVPGRTSRSTAPVMDPDTAAVLGIDEPEPIDEPDELNRKDRHA